MAISSAGCGPLPYRGERVPSRSSPECYLEQIWHNLELRNIACYLKNKMKTNNCKSLISQILKIRFCIKQFHQNVDLTTFPAPVRARERERQGGGGSLHCETPIDLSLRLSHKEVPSLLRNLLLGDIAQRLRHPPSTLQFLFRFSLTRKSITARFR